MQEERSIYALYCGDECLYVGLTKNPEQRLRDHKKRNNGCGTSNIPSEKRGFIMKILEKTTYELAHEMEARWIQRLKPEYNQRMSMPYEERCKLNKIRERERYGPLKSKEYLSAINSQKKGPPINCECGKRWDYTISAKNLDMHRKSKMHIAFLTSLNG